MPPSISKTNKPMFTSNMRKPLSPHTTSSPVHHCVQLPGLGPVEQEAKELGGGLLADGGGKEIGRSSEYKVTELSELESGGRMDGGVKEVEVEMQVLLSGTRLSS